MKEWEIIYRKSAYNFLLNHDYIEKVEDKIKRYLTGYKVDVKKMSGKWEGFLRLRIGKSRVVFGIKKRERVVDIIKADYRGNVY